MMKSLVGSRCQPAEFKRTIFLATPEAGTELSKVLEPIYWAGVGRSFSQGDRIEVCPDDNAWFADLRVQAVFTGGADVVVLNHIKFAEAKAESFEFAGHIIANAGPVLQWTVTRKATAKKPEALLRDGFSTSEAARDYAKDQVKSHAAA